MATLAKIVGRGEHTDFQAAAGVEALEVLRAHHIDLAFIDLRMPEMDGIELMTRVRKAYPGIKLVPMSAASDLSTVPSEFMAEASLTKPFMVEDVQAVLGQAFDLRLL